MAVNKVVMNGADGEEILVDLTEDTVTPETLAEGATAHDASGNVIEGKMPIDNVRYGEQTLTEEQKAQARQNIGVVGKGENGATYTPHISEDGELSWSNDKNLPNPEPQNITGPPYELNDSDVNHIRAEVVETLRPTKENLESRVLELEEDLTQANAKIVVLETAVANTLKGNLVKVLSLEEMTDPNKIYLLGKEDNYYEEYLVVDGKPEKIGDTEVDLTNYVTKSFLWNNARQYRHHISLKYRHSNERLSSAGSDGSFIATFDIVNTDPTPYTFTHNYAGLTPAVMSLDTAWQYLRLYRAIQLSVAKDDKLARGCSGASVLIDSASPYTARYAINDSISTKYYDFEDTDWKRLLVVHSTRIDTGNVGTYTLELSCGHPTFSNGREISLWSNKEEFYESEYTVMDSLGKARYSEYYCQHRLYCTDTVEELPLTSYYGT